MNLISFRMNKLFLLFLLFSTYLARENMKDSKYFEEFQKFMIKYNKSYQSEN